MAELSSPSTSQLSEDERARISDNQRRARRERGKWGDGSDLIVGLIASILIFRCLFMFAKNYDASRPELFYPCLLSGTLGASLGWAAGIFISPYGDGEREAFASLGKLVYGFLSGYAFSKIDPLVIALLKPEAAATSSPALIYATVALVAFLTSLALTYISRSYWR